MSTVDQHDHLAAEEIAEYAEGLVTDPATVIMIESHLAGCTRCEQVLTGIGEISAVLAADDVPPIPAVVAIQLEAVLAAEVHERRIEYSRMQRDDAVTPASVLGIPTVGPEPASLAGTTSGISGGRATDSAAHLPRSLAERRRRRARAVSALAAAATVTAFAIGAAIFSQSIDESRLYSGAGGAPAVRPQAPEAAEDGAGSNYTGPTPVTDDVHITASGQTFTAYTLSTSAQLLLSRRAATRNGAVTGGGGNPLVPTAGTPASALPGVEGSRPPNFSAEGLTLASTGGVARCVGELVPDPAAVQVLAVDLGTYDGQAAAMIVLSVPDDPSKAQVRVVNVGCGAGKTVEFLRTEIRRD